MSLLHILFIINFSILTSCLRALAQEGELVSAQYILNEEAVINISDYWIDRNGEYDIVRIEQGDLLLEGPTTPVVPFITHKIDLPLNAEIKRFEVELEGRADLGCLSIPAFQPPWPMPDPDGKYPAGGYIEAPKNIGVFPAKHYYYRIVKIVGYKQVIIRIFPFLYDTHTQHGSFYTSATVKVKVCVNARGIIKRFSAFKSKYRISEPIKTAATIKNISADEIKYLITCEVHNLAGNVVSANSQNSIIEGSESNTIPITVKAPSRKGAYRLVMKAFDEMNLVGSFFKEINVVVE